MKAIGGDTPQAEERAWSDHRPGMAARTGAGTPGAGSVAALPADQRQWASLVG